MKTKTLSTKIIILIISICFIGMSLVASICFIIARNIILNETIEKTRQIAIAESETINSYINAKKNMIEILGIDIITINNKEILEKLLVKHYEEGYEVTGVYIGFSDDSGIFSNNAPEYGTWRATERGWYKQTMENSPNTIVTLPYYDEYVEKMVVTVSKNIGKVNGLDAALAADIEINYILEVISNMYIAEGGYSFLVSQDNDIIAHKNMDFSPTIDRFYNISENEAYKEAFSQLDKGLKAAKVTDYDGVVRYIIPYTVSSCDWKLYAAIPESVIYYEIERIIHWILPAYIIILTIAVLLVRVVVKRYIIKPVNMLSNIAIRMSEGDLDVSFKTDSNDEIGMLCYHFSKVSNMVRNIITDIEEMSKIHSNGDYDYKLDSQKYLGAYKEVIEGVNRMTFMYVNNFEELLVFLQSLGDGNFEANVKKYPGKLSVGNKIVDNLVLNLKDINRQINILSESALNGNLSERVNAEKFHGDWKLIFSSLNSVMEAVSKPIKEASDVLQEMSKGNLSVKMIGDYKGDFSLIKSSMNFTINELSGYISEITETLKEVSNNNLTIKINKEYLGDFIQIKDSINKIVDVLNKMIYDISIASISVNEGAMQITDSSTILAQGASEQTETIERLTYGINNINEQSLKNAKAAEMADALSTKSMDNANVGSNEMKNMLLSIEGIKEASNNISKIMSVINDIAFQINLLALNAAIEAARAGEHGKGFAVVADEVGALASRSQEASKQTQLLIDDAINKINDGVEISHITSQSLDEIVKNVTKVSEIISNISDSSHKQAESISQISAGINKISGVVLSNSSIAEESSANAHELSVQANSLKEMLSVFKFNSY